MCRVYPGQEVDSVLLRGGNRLKGALISPMASKATVAFPSQDTPKVFTLWANPEELTQCVSARKI